MKWQLKPKAPAAFFNQFPEYSPLVAQLLYNRGLKSQREVDEFFNPDYQSDLHSPFLLKGMKKAVKEILGTIDRQERIVVYGDYDTDGLCATAILFLTLQELGAQELDIYIPDREREGHGLNDQVIRQLADSQTKLIITVDCGSWDIKEVDLANSLGLRVIIADHHQIGEQLPRAQVIINPWQKNDSYPFKKLAGAGIAYKLACALLSTKRKTDDPFQKWLLDLVAVATVADVMPIIGENRTLVKYGLGVLAQTRWLGLAELMRSVQIKPLITEQSLNGQAPLTNLNTYTLGYILGPRLNAAGRINHADIAFRLLVTQNQDEARAIVERLNTENTARQSLTDKIFQEIKKRLEKRLEHGESPKIVFEGDEEWPIGIVGLAASKIAERYRRPTIAYQKKGDDIFASCRSIPQFNLVEALEAAAQYFDDYGGHRGAAGFRMKKDNIERVKEIFFKLAEEQLNDDDLVPILEIDAELTLSEINWRNYSQIQKFEPFGKGNPEPRFLTQGVKVNNVRTVGNNGNHLKMELRMVDQESKLAKNFKAIGFGLGEWQGQVKPGDYLDIVFELVVDEWNGWRDLAMRVIDIRRIAPNRSASSSYENYNIH